MRKQLQKIAVKTILLVIEVLLLLYNVVRCIVLPSRKGKGNILSSIFLFFVLLAEKIVVFEKSLVAQSWLLKNSYVKRGLIIATSFLFLVSSFEWTVTQTQPHSETTTVTIVGRPFNSANSKSVECCRVATKHSFCKQTFLAYIFSDNNPIAPEAISIPKKYIRYNVLRI